MKKQNEQKILKCSKCYEEKAEEFVCYHCQQEYWGDMGDFS